MFKFLKEKLKGAINRITKKIEDKEAKVEVKKEEVKQNLEIQPSKKIEYDNEQILEQKEEVIEKKEILLETKKKNIFSKIKEKIVSKTLTTEEFEDLFWELELVLIENNVAVEVIERIKEDLKKELTRIPIERGKVQETIVLNLKRSL